VYTGAGIKTFFEILAGGEMSPDILFETASFCNTSGDCLDQGRIKTSWNSCKIFPGK
jgi:hypothetical protein